MRRAAVAAASLAAVLAAGGRPRRVSAQDIETVAALRGLSLPAGYRRRIAERPDFFELPGAWKSGRSSRAAAVRPAAADPVSGVLRMIVVPALFADSREPIFSPEDIQGTLFDGPAVSGTVTEFYSEASGGLLTVTGTTSGWVRTSLTVAEVVGASAGLGVDARVGEYLLEALALADPEVDFGRFDDDGPDGVPNSGDDDGFVDAMTFEFEEVSASCGGPAIWPHRSSLTNWTGSTYATGDLGPDGSPVRVDGYIVQSVTDCSGEVLQTANVIAHEFGHVLGLPDLYDPIDGIEPLDRRWVLGCWALMAAGTWGCGEPATRTPAFGPTHFSPWSKDRLGWIDWVEIGEVLDERFTLGPAQVSRQALRIPMDDEGREFLVVEFRPRLGFDTFLPVSGVLVYHWDLRGLRRPSRESGQPYLFSLEEADGREDLKRTGLRGGNRGEGTDAWGLEGRLGPINSLSVPSSRRNRLDQPSTVTIHSIEVQGDVATVRLTTAHAPTVLDQGELPSTTLAAAYLARRRMAGGALPYGATLRQSGPATGLTVRVEDEELVVEGAPALEGRIELPVLLTDARGVRGDALLSLAVAPFVVADGRLVGPFILNGEPPLTSAERDHLDAAGNVNGQFDIGDVRARLLRSGPGRGSPKSAGLGRPTPGRVGR